MKATELRIGNNIFCRNEIDTVCGIDIYMDEVASIVSEKFGVGERDIKPIPLSEKWLLKFGFEKSFSLDTECWIINGMTAIRKKEGKYFHEIEIITVHQLQNLYFALTGKELETKTQREK